MLLDIAKQFSKDHRLFFGVCVCLDPLSANLEKNRYRNIWGGYGRY
jgi:hypothetical protein